MKVKLTVVQGKPEGKEFTIPKSPFFIGRGSDCHLRPNSEIVSKRHCAIIVEEGAVRVCDLGSKNGTLVNGQRIEGEVAVNSGDLLQVGPLVFAFSIEHAQKAVEKPAESPTSAQPAPARSASSSSTSTSDASEEVLEDVIDWLGGVDAQEAGIEKDIYNGDTQTMSAMQTDQEIPSTGQMPDETPDPSDPHQKPDDKPAPPKHADTSKAASDILRKYFHRPRE